MILKPRHPHMAPEVIAIGDQQHSPASVHPTNQIVELHAGLGSSIGNRNQFVVHHQVTSSPIELLSIIQAATDRISL
jgi:hypothetical protein